MQQQPKAFAWNEGTVLNTAAAWTSANTVLPVGVWGLETDTGLTKIGDGSTVWTALPYASTKVLNLLNMQPSSGYDIVPRWAVSTTRGLSNGQYYGHLFQPTSNITVSNIVMSTVTGGTDTGGTTVRRMGLYTVSGTTATLVARTASDGTLFNTNNQYYSRAFDTTGGYAASVTLTVGSTYLVGVIAYNTGGTFSGPVLSSVPYQSTGTNGIQPYVVDTSGGLTDLPTTRTLAGNSISSVPWARLTP